MDWRKLALGLILLSSSCLAATWERPAGAYTPTNNSANVTKYQTDSSHHVNISSAKLDGDINKAFQGLNDIEARTAPSVIGKTGLFLTNDGASSYWSTVTPTNITFQAPPIFSVAGSPVTGSGTISLTLTAQASNTFLAGPLSGSASPTFRSISSSDIPFLVSNGVVTSNVSASVVTATTIAVTNGVALRGFVQSADLSISSAASINVVHNCGALPRFAWAELVDVTPEFGYSTGMTAQVPPYGSTGTNTNFALASDTVSTTLKLGAASTPLNVINLGSGASQVITNANWKIRAKVGC